MRQRSITFLFAILMSMVGVQLFAYDAKVDGIYYNFSENEAIVTGASSTYSLNKTAYTGSVVIPESVTYDGITYSVTGIGNYAFQGCEELTSLFIPNTVTSIGNSVFTGCKSLDTMIIPNSVTSIGYSAFYNSGLTSVTIGNSVADIGVSAFECCSNLTSITVQSGNTTYDSRDNCNAIIQTTTNTLVAGCKETVIPNSVTDIGTSAFAGNKSMTIIDIPNTVTSIGDFAFNGCSNLVSVNIPNSVTTIGNGAFLSCVSLNSVSIPNSVTSMGGGVFSGCSSLSSVTIGNSLSSIGYNVFADCRKLTSLTIGNSVESIGDYAFQGCSGLTSVVIPNSVKTIGNYAFERCYGLLSLSIPYSVTTIGDYAFRDCSGLTSISLSNSVTSIGKYAFYCCSGLTSITIPNSVTSVGDWAFEGCSSVSDMYCYANDIPSNSLSISKYGNAVLHVPADAVSTYQAMLPGGFNEVVAIDENVITDVTLIESQQTENQDKVYWNGEEMVFPTGYENFDHELNFYYAKENGIYSDYCNRTLTKGSWNYPGELLSQLKSIINNGNDYDFSYGEEFDFVDGRYRSLEDSVLIQVSPADADLTNADITLLNSKGEDVVAAGFITLVGAKRYDGNNSEAGLWVVKFKPDNTKLDNLLSNYDSEERYAVAVKDAGSYVASDYNLSLGLQKTKHAYDFNANDVSVANIHNRYIMPEQSPNGNPILIDDSTGIVGKRFCYELTWHPLSCDNNDGSPDDAFSSILFSSDTGQNGMNACDRHGHTITDSRTTDGIDNRHLQPLLSVSEFDCNMDGASWAKIEIEFPTFNENGEFTPIRGFFVTVDNHFGVEDDRSELNAWSVYLYKNVAKYPYNHGKKEIDESVLELFEEPIILQKGNKGVIYIKNDRHITGDVIGFRVHAVNLDGTLTDPDGRAFYVKVDTYDKMVFNILTDDSRLCAVNKCSIRLNPSDNYKLKLSWRLNNAATPVEDFFDFSFSTNANAGINDSNWLSFDDIQMSGGFGPTVIKSIRAAIKPDAVSSLTDGVTYKVTMSIMREALPNIWMLDDAFDIDIKKAVRGDADGDGHLDYNDVMALSAIVVSSMTGDDADPAADFNGDGEVDINDITALIELLTHPNQ